MLKIGSFSRVVLVCLGVSYSYLVLSRLMTCVLRGGKAYIESGMELAEYVSLLFTSFAKSVPTFI